MSSSQRTPGYPSSRDSTASGGGFTSIGNMIASPYSEDEPHDSIRTPVTPHASPPRVGTVQETRYLPPNKDGLVARVQSYEGELDHHESFHSDDYDEAILTFDKPGPTPSPCKEKPAEATARPVTVVHFPEPTLISPMKSNAPIRPSPQRPQIQIPQPTRSPGPALNTHNSDHFTIPTLPCSGTPVSPHLALPRSPFAAAQASYRESVSYMSSESIRGFDLRKEKKALFRG